MKMKLGSCYLKKMLFNLIQCFSYVQMVYFTFMKNKIYEKFLKFVQAGDIPADTKWLKMVKLLSCLLRVWLFH